MRAEAAGSQQMLRSINRLALVRQLFASPGMSRTDLAGAIGLTKSTVSLLVRDLRNEGWLLTSDVVATGDMGRRPTPLYIHPTRLLLIGAEVGIEATRVVATSLTGEVQACATASYGSSPTVEACVVTLSAALAGLQRELPAGQQFLGIGIGLPGGVANASGVVTFAPNLGWHDVPFAAVLREQLAGSPFSSLPLFVLNEADVAALGELEFNPASAADPLLYVSINQGLGAGVIVNDRLLTGSRGYAGEVGHMVLKANGPLCSCGRRGCAEALIAMRAMGRDSRSNGSGLSISEVRAQLDAGEPATLKAVSSAGHHLGMLLLNLATAYDPACIVLGGSVVGLGDALLLPALEFLGAHTRSGSSPKPEIRTSRFGIDAVAIGAAALVRHRLTRPALPMIPTHLMTADSKETA